MKPITRVYQALLAILATALLAGDAHATTYFVAIGGNDANPCASATSTTTTNQKRTISAGVACLSAGDTLYIHGGLYTGSANVIDSTQSTVRGGTDFGAGAITIAGVAGETVTMQPPDGSDAIKLASAVQNGAAAVQYLIVQDLILDGASQTSQIAQGVYFNGGSHHIRLLRLDIKNWVSDGVLTSEHNFAAPWSTHFEMLSNVVHNNGRGTGDATIHGMYLETSDNLYDGNICYHNAGFGMQLYDNVNPAWRPVSNNVVRNNTFYDNGVGTGGTGGLVVGYGTGNQVYNNLSYSNNGSGILIYVNASNTAIYNNTVANNGPYAGVNVQYIEGGVTIRNNILFNNTQGGVVDWGGSLGGAITQDHNLTVDPLFVSATDFHLQTTSPARATGVALASVTTDIAGIVRPVSGAPDLGAYQSVVVVVPPAPPALVVTSRPTTCLFTITGQPPDAQAGWQFQARYGGAAPTVNLGSLDSVAPYTATLLLLPGNYTIAAIWTRPGSTTVTLPTQVASCP